MRIFAFLVVMLLVWHKSFCQTDTGNLKVYWDTSLSMEQRALEKEIAFLDDYLTTNAVSEISLVRFSDSIKDIKNFKSNEGDWTELKSFLREVKHEGISDFNFLVDEESDIPSILFTDGFPRLKSLRQHYGKSQMDVVCATDNCNPTLERLSLYSRGSYQKLAPEKTNLRKTNLANFQRSAKSILVNGIIKDENGPLEDVAVLEKGNMKGTLSLADGSFAIKAMEGDSLTFQFIGKRTVVIPIKNNSKPLEVNLVDATEYLEEVIVVQSEKVQWLPKEKTLGYSVQTVEKVDMSISSGSINESLAGKFSGVQTNKNGLSYAIIRGFSSIEYSNFPLVIVDGIAMPRSNFNKVNSNSVDLNDILQNINPNDVVSVKVLKSLAATNRYGAEGSNGVILIQTIQGESKFTKTKDTQVQDSEPLEVTTFVGDINVDNPVPNKSYLKALNEQETIADKYNLYIKHRYGYENKPYYFIDVHNLFRPLDSILAEDILNSALAISRDEIPVLRTIAFYHQQAKRYRQAASIYEKIIELDSSRVQSYRDLANIHVQRGNDEKGLKIYNEMLKPNFKPVLESGTLKDIVSLELKNLVYRKGKQLDVSKITSTYKTAPRYDARVLLEWNDSNNEFEIEFISPDRKISKWSHTNKNNLERMQDELREGYNAEEFLLSQAHKGDWYLNIKTIGLKDSSPLFLKCSIQFFYGQAGQYDVEEVFSFNSGSNQRIVSKITIH